MAVVGSAFEISCTNLLIRRARSSPRIARSEAITVTREGKMGTIWAVVVGISRYKDTDLNLRYADRDAEEFAEFLRSPEGGKVDNAHIRVLINEQATRQRIFEALTGKLGRMMPCSSSWPVTG